MPRRKLAHLSLAVLGAFAFVACSDQSPVAPRGTADGVQYETILAQPVEGTYTISFQPTSSGLGVILVAYVADASGNPAESGTAIFSYCSLHGVPAPSCDCVTGLGSWLHWGTTSILGPTSAFPGYGFLTYDLIPPAGTTIGFRFQYLSKGNGIANHVSEPEDHTF